jgi:hypothetical protein
MSGFDTKIAIPEIMPTKSFHSVVIEGFKEKI